MFTPFTKQHFFARRTAPFLLSRFWHYSLHIASLSLGEDPLDHFMCGKNLDFYLYCVFSMCDSEFVLISIDFWLTHYLPTFQIWNIRYVNGPPMVHKKIYPKEVFLVHPVRGCTHLIEQGSYQTSLERWKWFFPFLIPFQPIKFKILFCRGQTCKVLTNAMTEFLPVVMVVECYWSDSMNESHFSLCGRVLCLDVWDCAASQSVKVSGQAGEGSRYLLHPKRPL